MNINSTADMVTSLLVVNVGAMLLLGVMSYVGSALALNWLESLDKRWSMSEPDRTGELALEKTPDRAPGPTSGDAPS